MMNKTRKAKSHILIIIGLLLIAAAFLLIGYNMIDEVRASSSVHEIVEELESSEELVQSWQPIQNSIEMNPGEIEIPDYILNPDMDMPETSLDGQEYIGVLEIPSHALRLPVISDWSYPALRISPCRYSGSAYTDDFVISAHNYRSHFGCLKSLPMGAEILFTDMDGNIFSYEVVERTTLNPEDVESMIDSEWDLTLFTCTVGGQYRVTVRCERMEESLVAP